MTRACACAALAAGLALAGCGGGGATSPRDIADRAGRNVGKIHSGDMHLRFTLGAGRARASTVGVDVAGPFTLRGAGPLAAGTLRYTQLAGSRTTTATVISDGRTAWVRASDRTVRLSAAQAAPLKAAGKGSKGPALELGHWLVRAQRTDGPTADGQPTDRITGAMDVPAALRDIISAGRSTPGGQQTAAELSALRDSVQSSSMVVVAGRRDQLLRSLRARITFAVPPRLRARVGGRYTVVASFDLTIARPNRPIATPRAPG